MQLLANAKQQFIDQNGAPLANGSVYFYAPGTTNPMPTYQDRAGTILNTNPVLLDSRGQAVIWGNGTYRQVLKDASGVTIWDQITEDTNEGLTGNITDNVFVAGTDFTPGTTASLTLTVSPGSLSNTWIYFDAAYQDDSQATLSGSVLTFSSPIPVGVSKVTVKSGTTISIGTPNAGTVVDSCVASGTALYNRLTQTVSVMDPLYGAKGDGVTDDTSAIQNCISANAYVFFPPGKTFKTTATITVPASCKRIDAAGAKMVGPGKASSIYGFSFSGLYQGGGTIVPNAELYVLPSLSGYKYGVYIYNSAFLKIYSDTIQNCVAAWFVTCDNSSNYCFELDLESRFIFHCQDVANTTGGAFYMQATGTSDNAFQGNRCRAFYVDDVWTGVYQEFSSTGTNGNINNVYDLGELDQSNHAVYCTGEHSSCQLYKIPMGITTPNSPQMFVNVGTGDAVVVGGTTFVDTGFTAANNFQYNGCGARPFIYQQSGGVPTLYVDPVGGNDSTGTGHDTQPFRTIQKAVNTFKQLDLNGGGAFIALRDGTYSAGATLSTSVNGSISFVGNPGSPQNVVVNGSFTASGQGVSLNVSGMNINGGVAATNYGVVNIGSGVTFGSFGGGSHLLASNFGQVLIGSNYSVTGLALFHMNVSLGGLIQNSGATAVTLSGTLPFTTFANAGQSASITVPGVTYSVSGSVTGVRYSATLNGTIFTNGGGASYFPGGAAGSTSTGGQYA